MEELRKVLYVVPGSTGFRQPKEFNAEGYFHRFVENATTTDSENGMMQHKSVVALVETAEGMLIELSTANIKFVEPYGKYESIGSEIVPGT